MSKTRRDVKPWRDEETLRWAYTEKNQTIGEVASVFGVSYSTIHKWMGRCEVETRSPSGDRFKQSDTPWRSESRLRELLVGKGLSAPKAAEELGCSAGTVVKWASRCGVEHGRGGEWRDEETLRELYEVQNKTQSEMADLLGCDQKTIHNWMNRHGVSARKNSSESTPWQLRHRRTLQDLYWSEGLSTTKIADLVGTTSRAVVYWMDKHNLSRRPPSPAGAANSNWGGGPTVVRCAQCEETKEVRPSHAKKHDRHFCSPKCEGIWRSENMSGENAPAWQGGGSDRLPVSQKWSEQSKKARERDAHTCQDCGQEGPVNGRALPVHHITPRREYVDEEGNYDAERADRLENLITLCPSCHGKWEQVPGLSPDTRDAVAD